MEMTLSDYILIAIALVLASSLGVYIYIKNTIKGLIDIDVQDLIDTYNNLIDNDLEHNQAINKIIRTETAKSFMMGTLTGALGIFALPISLPIDIVCSMVIQFRLVKFISTINNTKCNMTNVLVGSSNQLWKYFSKSVITKVVSKSVPIVGAFVGGSVDASITYMSAKAQLRIDAYTKTKESQ
jgi:hypothetical protein